MPAAITLAQASIESGNGKHHIGSANNYFGIKAFNGRAGGVNIGPVAKGYTIAKTREVVGGRTIVVDAKFRTYNSMDDSFTDHGIFLSENRRYNAAMQNYARTGDATAFARALQTAGYATDPTYAQKLIGIINKYNLQQYDAKQPQ